MVTDYRVKTVLSLVFGLEPFSVCGVGEAEAEAGELGASGGPGLRSPGCCLQGSPRGLQRKVQTEEDGCESQRQSSASGVRWDLCLSHCPLSGLAW